MKLLLGTRGGSSSGDKSPRKNPEWQHPGEVEMGVTVHVDSSTFSKPNVSERFDCSKATAKDMLEEEQLPWCHESRIVMWAGPGDGTGQCERGRSVFSRLFALVGFLLLGVLVTSLPAASILLSGTPSWAFLRCIRGRSGNGVEPFSTQIRRVLATASPQLATSPPLPSPSPPPPSLDHEIAKQISKVKSLSPPVIGAIAGGGALLLLLLVVCCCCFCRVRRGDNGRGGGRRERDGEKKGEGGWGRREGGKDRQTAAQRNKREPLQSPASPSQAPPYKPGGYIRMSNPDSPLISPQQARMEEGLKEDPSYRWEHELRASQFRKVSLLEVSKATNGFSELNFLGEGAFAKVYKGKVESGDVQWAVKRAKGPTPQGSQGAGDFEKEVVMISRLAHKNLVRLLGYCTEGQEQILIYEFAENGSLREHIHRKPGETRPPLSLVQRLDIAIGTADALHYLHNAASPPIVHRDIKPDNILLDRRLQAKVGDFGLLKNLMEGHESESAFTRIAGTPGYLDPEYHLTSKITPKGDIYSFGVVLLELFTGLPPVVKDHTIVAAARNAIKSPRSKNTTVSSVPSAGSGEGGEVNGAGQSGLVEGETGEVSVGGLEKVGVRGGASEKMEEEDDSEDDPRDMVMHISTLVQSFVDSGNAIAVMDPSLLPSFGKAGVELEKVDKRNDQPVSLQQKEHWGANGEEIGVLQNAILKVLQLGLKCVGRSSRKRPNSGDVISQLADVRREVVRSQTRHDGTEEDEEDVGGGAGGQIGFTGVLTWSAMSTAVVTSAEESDLKTPEELTEGR